MNLTTETVPLDALTPHPRNVRQGDVGAISESLKAHGQYRPIVAQRSTGHILAGNHTFKAAQALGWSEIAVTFLDVSDDQAVRIMLADNRTNDLATYDDDGLVEFLKEMAATDAGLHGTAFADDDIDELLVKLGEYAPETKLPAARNIPIDMIFTQTLLGMCCVAVGAGLLYGKQSGKSACGNATTSARHRLTFLDNDWKNYRHDVHVAETAEYRPKYVTTRDLITPEQASRMGIAHQTIEQTIDQADELAQYADQVIVIPKFDCIDLIPDRFMLGYSIPTSHGGTPLPIARFKGRKVHLLGGSWRSQLSFLAEMGDDVVSVDNNYILKQARWGNFTRPDGTDSDLNGLGIVLPPYRHHAAVYVASVISINSIVAAIRVLYDQPDDAADDAAAEDQLR